MNGKVRFASPNKGVPPADWGRISGEDWTKRVGWADWEKFKEIIQKDTEIAKQGIKE